MKQIYLKFSMLLLCLVVGLSSAWGKVVTFDATKDKPDTNINYTKEGITIQVGSGTLANGTDYRVYKSSNLKISSSIGNITKIELTYTNDSYDGGGWAKSYTLNSSSWTSKDASGEQARITKIVVTTTSSQSIAFPNTNDTPYSVSEAKELIDTKTSTELSSNDVFVKGTIATVYSFDNGTLTYYLEDGFLIYKGKNLSNAPFYSINDIKVGAQVVIKGKLQKYNSTYEVNTGNFIYSYIAPAITIESPMVDLTAGAWSGNQNTKITNYSSDYIYVYTTDGTDPLINGLDVSNGSVYDPTKGIDITQTCTLKIIAVDGDGNKSDITAMNYTISKSYKVTIETPANGTLTIKNGESVVKSGDEVEEGITLTVECVPSDGYRFKNWGYKDGDANWVGNNTMTFTHVMPAAPVSFKATFEEIPFYTIQYSVNGSIEKTEHLSEGTSLSFPEKDTTTPYFGKYFRGWVETSTVNSDEEPQYVQTSIVKASADIIYYAVFADKTPGSGSGIVSDVLTQSTTGVTETSYKEWTGKKANSKAEYAGQSAGGNSSIQMRSNNNNSGIVSTVSGGRLAGVSVDWNSNTTNGRTLQIYGSVASYDNATKLYGENPQGVLLGEIVCGTSNTLTINGNYSFVGVRSKSGALYLNSITITWEDGVPDTYSNFTTAIGYTRSVTSGNYGTICLPAEVKAEDRSGATFYNVAGTSVKDGDVDGIYLSEEEGDLEAGKPYIFKATDATLTCAYSGNSVTEAISATGLVGNLSPTKMEVPQKRYILSSNQIRMLDGGTATIGQNRAYIDLEGVSEYTPNGSTKVIRFGFNGDIDEVTSIYSISSTANKFVYNLKGMKMNSENLPKGIYIVNGKKVVK